MFAIMDPYPERNACAQHIHILVIAQTHVDTKINRPLQQILRGASIKYSSGFVTNISFWSIYEILRIKYYVWLLYMSNISVEGIKNKVNELLTIDNAKRLIQSVKDNAPSREEVETSIATLQDMLKEIRSKAVQGVSSASSFYQKTIKSPEMETIIARVYKSKTKEERKREWEKIRYL